MNLKNAPLRIPRIFQSSIGITRACPTRGRKIHDRHLCDTFRCEFFGRDFVTAKCRRFCAELRLEINFFGDFLFELFDLSYIASNDLALYLKHAIMRRLMSLMWPLQSSPGCIIRDLKLAIIPDHYSVYSAVASLQNHVALF